MYNTVQRGYPAADAAGIGTEEVGDALDGVARTDTLDSQAPAVLPNIGGACWSHASK